MSPLVAKAVLCCTVAADSGVGVDVDTRWSRGGGGGIRKVVLPSSAIGSSTGTVGASTMAAGASQAHLDPIKSGGRTNERERGR